MAPIRATLLQFSAIKHKLRICSITLILQLMAIIFCRPDEVQRLSHKVDITEGASDQFPIEIFNFWLYGPLSPTTVVLTDRKRTVHS